MANNKDFPIAYQTFGKLNEKKNNAILIFHALTGDQFVTGNNPITNKEGWWSTAVGPGKAVDTNKYFIICANVLGGCMGSFGPKSINKLNNKTYGLNFPVITIRDMVRAQETLLEHLKIDKLLSVLGIESKNYNIQSFHDHSQDKVEYIISSLENGLDIYLVSDAGSPIVSDPAFPLVRAAIDAGINIQTIPGCSAVTSALELSGLPPAPFMFWGFLARDDSSKRVFFEKLSAKVTHIFFESPHRIEKTLKLIGESRPTCQIVVAREITKKFESIYRFEAQQFCSDQLNIIKKGEFVVLCHDFNDQNGKSSSTLTSKQIEKAAMSYIEKGSTKNLSKLIALCLGKAPKEAYELLLSSKEKS